MASGRLLTFTLVVALVAAGCIGAATEDVAPAEDDVKASTTRTALPLPPAPAEPAPSNETPGTSVPPVERFFAQIKRGTLDVHVPVPVVLIGFPQTTADALAAALEPRKVDHDAYNNPNALALNDATYTTPLPIVTTAQYRVYRADDATHAQLIALLDGPAKLSGKLHDANMVEDWLAQRLAPDPTAPALVLLAIGGERTYRYTLPGGALENVRVFGERQALLAVDVTAPSDPWVGTSKSYDVPLDVSDAASVDALAELVAEATHHRLLQGPLYPPSTRECHAITILALERATSLSTAGLLTSGVEMLDQDALLASFGALMGAPVHVDVKLLMLPVDDPILAALTTGGSSDALRSWLEMNFASYHVAHEGCEAYLSVVVDGDAADSTHGIAEYDATHGSRISFSFVDDLLQICFEQGIGLSCYDRSPESFDWFTFLVAHETGHLLGQRHPHDITGGDVSRTWSFSSVWSPMSYQVGDSVWDFGAIDRNNQMRNRVAYLIAEAGDAAAADTSLLDALSLHDWSRAETLLRAFQVE